MFFVLIFVALRASAFTGSDLTYGQKYYLFNIYQSKFLGADNKLQAPNIGTPVAFTASATGFTIGGTAYTATKNAAGFYQLKNGSNFFAFEDKVNDPNSPDDENRRMYPGGGVLCKNTTNDTDRSYWQLISETEYAEWQAKKKFTVASLNVDGMPKSVKVYNIYPVDLNPDATEGAGATRIGNKLRESGFDVVGVSEDFDYHSELWNAAWNNGTGVHYNATTHRGKLQDAASAAGVLIKYRGKNPIIDSDGLCFFYRMGIVNQSVLESSEAFYQWNEHNGYDTDGADGLIKKGYRYYLVTLADGTEIDLYTMHMDAESGEGDCNARASQLTQLVNAIKATHNGRPIVIIGDSNCRYTRDKVKSNLIDAINADERFTIRDPWIMFGRSNTYPAYGSTSIMAESQGYLKGEVVDKIWFINNTESNIRLTAETYHQDLSFVDESGSPLCDHKPCVVTFSYHNDDPLIDDVAVVETTEEPVYLRNRATGRFLKSGGAWGTHSIVGNYPLGVYIIENNGKYALKTNAGYVTSQVGDEAQTFVDGGDSEDRSVKDWTILEKDGYKIFTRNGRAISANDPYFFNDDPNYRWVILDNLNEEDKLQQWEILTKEQMMEEMNKATALSPYNATWLLSNPNFDRNLGTGGWNNNISKDAGRMTSNLGGDGQNTGAATDNMVAEAYVANKNSDGTTLWDINQVVENVPNGWYRVTCQAFQRISNNNTTTADIQLYAKSGATEAAQQVALMYDLKEITSTGMGTKKDGNYYYPNSMAEAALYFNKGYYQNEILVQVTNGKLTLGIRKTSNTGKSNNAWTCFDNFQLIYLGTEQPESSYYLYNVESGMFLNGGNAYGTQASVADEGQEWTPQYKSSGVQLLRKDQANGLYVAGNGLYVDGANPAIWHGTGFDNHAFTLAPTNDRENVIGWNSEAKGTVVRDKFIKGERELTDGIHWTAIPQSQYASYKSTAAANKTARLAAVDVYRSAVLDANVDAADFKALWNNPTTTADQITSAAATLKAKIEDEAVVKATAENGYNYSYYINNATCGDDAHTGWTKTGDWGSNTGATHSSNGLVLAPRFYEAWDANALSNRKISQTISNLPAGFYKLALDVNAEKQNDNAAVIGTLLYAKVGTADRVTTVCDTHGDGVIINTFETPIFTVNAGESVEIGLSLENTNANWVAFDNWQLIYCGPYRECSLDNQTNPTKWVLTGTWREVDMKHITTSYDTSTQLLLDATRATFVGKPTIPMADDKPNMMIKVSNADDIANTANVIVGSQCANLLLTDKMDFAPQQTFTASKTLYTRSNTQGYNTVCMPFETQVADYEGCVVYEYYRTNAETITFIQLADDATIAAGKPVLVYSEGGADWAFDLSNRSVEAVADGQTEEAEGLNGSFLKRDLGLNYYKLNSAGTKFVMTTATSTITPFRFYLLTPKAAAKSFSLTFMDDDEETSIDELLNNPSTKVTETYDLNGRRVLHITRPGVYVKNGKKVVVK